MKVERSFKGIWIPSEIWLDKNLTIMEKLFLVEINSLDNDNGCFASNGYFSQFFGVGKNRCSQIIVSLEEKGLISSVIEKKNKQIVRRTLKVINMPNIASQTVETPYPENGDTPTQKMVRPYPINDDTPTQKMVRPYPVNGEDSNTINNTTIKEEATYPELDVSLTEIFSEYLKVRKSIRIKDDDFSINLMIKNLNKHSLENQTEMLENAITGRYKVLYPIKTQNNNVSKFQKKYDIDDGIEKVAERNIPNNHQPWLNDNEAGEQV